MDHAVGVATLVGSFNDRVKGAWGARSVLLEVTRHRHLPDLHALQPAQRELLEAIGVTPLPPEQKVPTEPSKAATGAFERGVEALRQYKVGKAT
ncbi:hypothetical protein AB0K74_26890 [Streptomyces sp. NPDC056159]|uniref:hypothetical protein n=1 Tax=unclassified Streptomyces TaxID=2593676 RepID=UPI0034207B7F